MTRPPSSLLAAFAMVVIAGAAIGGGLAARDVVSVSAEPDPPTLAITSVATYTCPGGRAAATLWEGDRILLTGQTEDGDWVQLRDPRNLEARVWVHRDAVTVGDDPEALPVAPCEEGTATGADTEEATDTTAPPTTGGATSTEPSGSGSTLPPATGATPGDGDPARGSPDGQPGDGQAGGDGDTDPAGPGDTTGPAVSVSVNPTEIFEFNLGGPGSESCNASGAAVRAAVVLSVSDPAGVAQVTATYAVGGAQGPLTITGTGPYIATLGPFGATTIDTSMAQVTITVRATDRAGNITTRTTAAILRNCEFV